MATTPEQLFADRLAADPGRPFVTYYDLGTGERSELSAKSLANWVVKTHHLLGDELGLGAGDRALLALPAHWISLAPLLGALTAGLAILTPADPSAGPADVAFVTPDTLAAAGGAADVFAIAPESARTGFAGPVPPGTADYVAAARPHEDKWPSVRLGAGPADAALAGRTRAEVVEWARARASELGLGDGARVLSTREWSGPLDLVDTVLAPLAVGGSLVQVRGADPAALDRLAAQERATARLT